MVDDGLGLVLIVGVEQDRAGVDPHIHHVLGPHVVRLDQEPCTHSLQHQYGLGTLVRGMSQVFNIIHISNFTSQEFFSYHTSFHFEY